MSNDIFNEPLGLVSIKELIDKKCNFFVPAYQRGYRWRANEINTLINDIIHFINEEEEKAKDNRCPFYCLQALIVKENLDKFEVIDGQQRLTTILLILQAAHTLSILKSLDFFKGKINLGQFEDFIVDSNLYSIKYETRCGSDSWLKNITCAYIIDTYNKTDELDKLQNENPDYFHFVEVFKAAIDLLTNMKDDVRNLFMNYLKGRTSLIWYNISKENNVRNSGVDIFGDINATRIDLNNAELIKAIFLQKENFKDETYRLNQMAVDWDNIEKRLQDPSFWGFIYSTRHPYEYTSHIEYLFDLIQKKTIGQQDNYFYTFNCYHSNYLESSNKEEYVSIEWEKVKKMMLNLEEWYHNKTCYHYIGYLLEYGKNVDIPYLEERLRNKTKTERKEELKAMIKVSMKDVKPTKLFHCSHELTQVLFLLNIQTEENRDSDTARFSFSKYKEIQKNPGWNQEHVASNTDYTPKYEDRLGLANTLLEYFTGLSPKQCNDNLDEYKRKIEKIIADKKFDNSVQKLCESLLEFYDYVDNDESVNKMSNTITDIINYFSNNNDDDFHNGVQVGNATKNEKDFIWNFALLNASTNKSYSNDIFPLKRQRIMRDEECVYTPVCTRAMFEKAYSRKLSNLLVWGRSDAKDFWDYLCNTLSEFTPEGFSSLPFKFD